MGFEYDLAKAFADFLGVRLNVKVIEKWEEMIPAIENGSGDFIAASMAITPERLQQALFSNGYYEIYQHIISNRSGPAIRTVDDLVGKTIHVRRGTTYEKELEALRHKGIDLNIQLHDNMPTQELIRRVANNETEITVADTNIALLNRRYYPKIVVSNPISGKGYLGWAVNPNATHLRKQINLFFKTIKDNGQFDSIYKRYYSDIERFDYIDLKAFHKRIKTRLPKYRHIIQTAAEKNEFDWRLIAAQIYQESHYNYKAKSSKRAYGLMQLTPPMADSYGVKNILDPEQNVEAGTRHLKDLYDYFDKATPGDRLYLALAAYNIGLGHIWDARDLARERNLDPNKWSSLEKTLPLLRYQAYNKTLRFGYARGTEPVKYIRQIMIYYDILKHQGIEYNTDVPSYDMEKA